MYQLLLDKFYSMRGQYIFSPFWISTLKLCANKYTRDVSHIEMWTVLKLIQGLVFLERRCPTSNSHSDTIAEYQTVHYR